MKTPALILLFLPLTIVAQWCPNADDLGTLKVEVYGNSAILKNDTVCRNCGSMYEMVIYPLEGDTLCWLQDEQFGGANCDCTFDLSVTLDSLFPGNYYIKTYYERVFTPDTIYIGLISFTITAQNSFTSFVITDEYQSDCYTFGMDWRQEQTDNKNMAVHPNPAISIIFISMDALTGDAYLSILNVSGEKVIEQQIQSNEIHLDISALPQGVYFVRVWDEKAVQVAKFVKE